MRSPDFCAFILRLKFYDFIFAIEEMEIRKRLFAEMRPHIRFRPFIWKNFLSKNEDTEVVCPTSGHIRNYFLSVFWNIFFKILTVAW